MKLYYHKTRGGAEYLMDKFIVCPNGEKEGVFEGSSYIVRIDGDIEKDAELSIRRNKKNISDFEKYMANYIDTEIERAKEHDEGLDMFNWIHEGIEAYQSVFESGILTIKQI